MTIPAFVSMRRQVSNADRRTWTAFQQQVATLATQLAPAAERVRRATSTDAAMVEQKRQVLELMSRIGTLYSATSRWTGRPTADQRTQLAYYQEMTRQFERAR